MKSYEKIIRDMAFEIASHEEDHRYEYGDYDDPICAPDCEDHSDLDEAAECWFDYYNSDRVEKWEAEQKRKAENNARKVREGRVIFGEWFSKLSPEEQKRYREEHEPPEHYNCRCELVPVDKSQQGDEYHD